MSIGVVLACASALFVSGADAVTFSASFEKTLASGLAPLAQDVQVFPQLQAAVVGVPLDVAGWAALSQDDIFAKLTLLSTQKADAVQYLVMEEPTKSAHIEKFMDDSTKLILAFAEAIESGDYAKATEPIVLQGGAAPSSSASSAAPAPGTSSLTSSVAPTASALSSVGVPMTPAPKPTSAPVGVAGPADATTSKLASGATAGQVSVSGSAPAGGSAVTTSMAPTSATGTVSKSVSGPSTGTATGTAPTDATSTAFDASTPASTNSTGVSAVSLSVDTNSSENSLAGGAHGASGTSSGSAVPVQALTPTAGSAKLAVSTVGAVVFVAACVLAQ